MLTEAVEHKGTLDSQLDNAKQLVDNMNKNKVLKQIFIQGKDRGHLTTLTDNLKNIDKATQNMKTDRARHDRLAKEKVNAKADLQHHINALDAQISEKHSRSMIILTELSNELRQRQDDPNQSAAEAVESGNLFGALDLLTEAVCCRCSSALLYCRRAQVLLLLGRPRSALIDSTADLHINSDLGRAYSIRARTHAKLKHWLDAHSDFQESLKIDYDENTYAESLAVAARVREMQVVIANKRLEVEEAHRLRKAQATKAEQQAAALTNPMMHFAVNEQSERFAPPGSIKAVLQASCQLVALVEEEKSDIIKRNTIELDETSLEGNVKERNAMIIELNDEKFYIIFAQFEQRQKEMVNHPISQCLYLHKPENEADPVESEFYSPVKGVTAGSQEYPQYLWTDHCRVPEGMHLPRLRRSGNAHWQRGAVSKVRREVLGTAQSRSKMSTYKQKTRTRELYSRERPNDDGDLTSGGGPDGESTWLKPNVHG